MTWTVFERAVKFLAAIGWSTWEIMLGPGRTAVLTFLATVLAASEVPHVLGALRPSPPPPGDTPTGSPSPSVASDG